MEYRVEQKYLVTETELAVLQGRLQAVMAFDANQTGDSYEIRSAYFDDLRDSCVDENESGIDQRQKFRIRTYAPALNTYHLEIKEKSRGFTKKRSCALQREEVFPLMEAALPITPDQRAPLNSLYLPQPIDSETKYTDLQGKLTLKHQRGGNRNLSMLGLGSDDDWILNPLSLDETKVKEQLLMSLWNGMAKDAPWDSKISEGAYCEVVINGSYRGLYLLQRRIDKKYLDLDNDELLLKLNSTAADTELRPENCETIYSPFSQEETSTLLSELCDGHFGESIVPENYADVSIFTQLGYLNDNNGFRNQFYRLTPTDSGYETRILLWDMDMSMGLCQDFAYDYELTTTNPLLRVDYDEVLKTYPHMDSLIAKRWFELRKTWLSDETILGTLAELAEQLNASGALARDAVAWNAQVSSPPENFLRDRLAWLDGYYQEKLA